MFNNQLMPEHSQSKTQSNGPIYNPCILPTPNSIPIQPPKFVSIDQMYIPQLRALNASLFPFPYNDQFYSAVVHARQYAFAAFIDHHIIGAVCCRIEMPTPSQLVPTSNLNGHHYQVYIMTLGVLLMFRRRKIASTLLHLVIQQARSDIRCASIYLHVQTSNSSAFNFYIMHGFVQQQIVPDYYPDLCPTSAYLLVLPIHGSPSIP